MQRESNKLFGNCLVKRTFGKEVPFRKAMHTLKKLHPQLNREPLKHARVRNGHWKDKGTQRVALEKLGQQLGVKQLNDWYTVDAVTVKSELSFISNYYNNSLYNTLKELYPQHEWDPLKFSSVPRGYWKDTAAQRDALEKLGIRLGVKQLDDWYSVDADTVRSELSFIYRYYNNSLYTALKELYPQHEWNPLKFSYVPLGYWRDTSAQRDALEKLGINLGVKQLDDWYSVDAATFRNKLWFINNYYSGSLYTALKELYPQHEWDPLKFSSVPQGYWKDTAAQRDALEKLGIRLKVKQLDDWYSVDADTVRSELSFISIYHNGSLFNALKELYPLHGWDPLKFSKTPKGYWHKPATVQHFHDLFRTWKEQHHIERLKDWYQLPPQQLRLFQRASSAIFGSITQMLLKWFPETTWMDEVQGSAPEIELQVLTY